MAKNGLAVLCFDPVGQGERKQVLDENGKARFGPTAEHSAAAPSCTLLGRNVASVEIWDGMRSIDYLQSRPEIDPTRIGCAGNSGGGTQTAYLMALDDRIGCAAPNCYLTNFRRLLETIGPQDAEQNLHAQLAFGLDQPDYVLLRAPKPTLIAAVTRDFFDIDGTWQTFRQAKRFYGRLGFPERVELVEDDNTHGFTRLLREATTRWLRRWLLGKDDPVTEIDFPVMTDAELQCTPRGQVLFLPGARSLFDLNREEETGLARQRHERFEKDPAGALAAARRLAGVRPLGELGPPRPEQTGSSERGGCRVDTLLLPVEPGLRLPALAFVPPDPGAAATLYLHGEGKQADAAPGGPIEQLVKAGHLVLAVDLRGLGEFQGRNSQGQPAGTSGRDVATAYLLGRSFVGMRAEEILRCARLLASWDPGKPGNRETAAIRKVHLVAVGEAALPALHAAAFEPDRFASVKLVRCLRSWVPVVGGPAPGQQVNVVHGALTTYDLPDLYHSLPAEKSLGLDGPDAAR
jgi:dienelactone hydrolase